MSCKFFLIFALALAACGSRTDNVATSVAATLTAMPAPTELPSPTLEPPTAPPLPTSTGESQTRPDTPTPITPGATLGQHTVQQGETLFCIGRAYGVRPDAIASANKLDPNVTLTLGQILQIPAVQWTDIAPGAVCAPQFVSPFPGLPFATFTPGPGGILAPLPTPGPDPRGPEAILILAPGPGSAVTSTIHVAGEADSTFEQSLVILVTDAEGKFLSITPAHIAAELGQRGQFIADVPVTVLANQPGRISVYAVSPRDGGLTHLAGVEVNLLAAGAASLVPAQLRVESLALFEPKLLATLSGGTVHLTGFSDYVFENQLGVVICGEGGTGERDLICGTKDNLLGAGGAYVNSPDLGQPGAFTGNVNYTVTKETRGRIVVYDTSPRDGGVTHLASVEVVLTP